METLFTTLSHALNDTPVLALCAAFAWGVCSVILSPCHLASIPLVVGFIGRQGLMTARRTLLISTLFAAGILITIAGLGALTAALGRVMGDVGGWGNYFVALLFFAVGLYLLGVIGLPWSGPGQVNLKRKGLAAALLLGLIFGIAVGPCTFAFMAPVLGLTFKLAASHLLFATALLALYAAGHCAVIVVAGASVGLVQGWLDWNERSREASALRVVCGVLVIAGGLYLIYVAH